MFRFTLESTVILLLTFRTGICKTSCRVSGGVEGSRSSISCHFAEDITVHKHSVNILKYDLAGRIIVPDLVFKCFWPSVHGSISCNTTQGYGYDEHIDSSIKLYIPETTSRHAGFYVCDYSAASIEERVGCRLHVIKNKISCEASEANLGEQTNITCIFNSDLTKTKQNFFVYRPTRESNGYEDILTCNFLDSGELNDDICYVKDGFAFSPDKDLNGNRVTVHIRNAQKADSTKYFCDTAPSHWDVFIVECFLSVTVKPADKPTSVATAASTLSTSVRGYSDTTKENGTARFGQSTSLLLLSLYVVRFL